MYTQQQHAVSILRPLASSIPQPRQTSHYTDSLPIAANNGMKPQPWRVDPIRVMTETQPSINLSQNQSQTTSVKTAQRLQSKRDALAQAEAGMTEWSAPKSCASTSCVECGQLRQALDQSSVQLCQALTELERQRQQPDGTSRTDKHQQCVKERDELVALLQAQQQQHTHERETAHASKDQIQRQMATQLKQQQQEVAELQDLLSRSSQQLDEARHKGEEGWRQAQQAWTEHAHCGEMKSEVDSASGQVHSARQEVALHKDALLRVTAECSKLKDELQQVTAAAQQQAQRAQQQAQREAQQRAQQEAQRAQQQVVRLNDTEPAAEALDVLRLDARTLEQQLESNRESANSLIEEHETKYAALHVEHAACSKANRTLQVQLQSATYEIHKLTDANEVGRSNFLQLEHSLAQALRELHVEKALTQHNFQSEEQLHLEVSQLKDKQHGCSDLWLGLEQTKLQLRQAEEQISKVERAREPMAHELQEQLTDVTFQLETTKLELGVVTKELTEELQTATAEMQRMVAAVERAGALEVALSQAVSELQSAMDELAGCRIEHEQRLEEVCGQHERRLEEMRGQLEVAEMRQQTQGMGLDCAQLEVAEMRQQMQGMGLDCAQLEVAEMRQQMQGMGLDCADGDENQLRGIEEHDDGLDQQEGSKTFEFRRRLDQLIDI